MSAQISICIPTRNRAPFLRDCLLHLKSFSKLRLEVVVFDNASNDATADIAREFQRGSFTRFVYHRHPEDIGVARNMDAALRLATAPYIWVLSDDDIAYQDALIFLMECLERTAPAVAACGGYATVHRMNVGAERFTPPESITEIAQGDLEALAANVLIADGHPLMRREIFQRHCRMEERGFGLLPLYGQLLRHGQVLHINRPVMEHLTNPDSLSTSLTEPWFMDFVTSDIELAMTAGRRAVALSVLDRAKNALLGMTYLQAARMARIQADALLARHFLLRAKAIGMIDDESLVHWETAFLVDAAVQCTAQRLQDIGAKKVILEDVPALRRIAQQLEQMSPGIRCEARAAHAGSAGHRHDARICWGPAEGGDRQRDSLRTTFSFLEIVETCRVSEFPISIVVDQAGNCVVQYQEEHAAQMLRQSPQGFQIVMSDYRMA